MTVDVIPSLPAIRGVLASYRSTDAHVTEEQITAAWAEYEAARAALSTPAGPPREATTERRGDGLFRSTEPAPSPREEAVEAAAKKILHGEAKEAVACALSYWWRMTQEDGNDGPQANPAWWDTPAGLVLLRLKESVARPPSPTPEETERTIHDPVERGAAALCRFVFPGAVVPRREMAQAVLDAAAADEWPDTSDKVIVRCSPGDDATTKEGR